MALNATNDSWQLDTEPNQISSPEISIFYAVFLSILSFLIVASNTSIILAFWRDSSLREKPSDLLILNLAVFDLALGFILFTFSSPEFVFGKWKYEEFGCKIYVLIGDITGFGSLLALSLISTDRLLLVGVEYPRYLKLQSRPHIHATIFACWIISLIPMSIEIGLWEKAKEFHPAVASIDFDDVCLSPIRRIDSLSLAFFAIFIAGPTVIVTAFSVAFLFLLKRRLTKDKHKSPYGRRNYPSRDGKLSTGTSFSTVSLESTNNRYIKPALTLGVLVFSMIICTMPYCFYAIIIAFCTHCANSNKILQALIILQYCRALLDPLFYAMTQRKIRNYYKRRLQYWCSFRR